MKEEPMAEEFDVIIVGGGPAALSAAIYAGRAEMKTLVLERMMLGGQVSLTWDVANYPGFPDGIDGPALIERMQKQAAKFDAEFRTEEVTIVNLDGDAKVVKTSKNEYRCPVLILAMGADPKQLGVPGEKELRGKGVSYCGTCDGPFFRNKKVVVVGGGDAALKEGIFLTRFANEIVLVHRRSEFRAEKIYQTEVRENPKIRLMLNCAVERINGEKKVESADIRDLKKDEVHAEPCDGVFIFIGHAPNTKFLCNLWPDQCGGAIGTDMDMMTNIPGVFAIGDVRKNSYRQIATAVGEGATAAIAAEHYISEIEAKSEEP
ncbi:MAG: thioredoxin-disulfide reductase [Planctomycetota bacterium]